MALTVRFHDAFQAEFDALDPEIRATLLIRARLLAEFGPRLGRPHVDTLKGWRFANMKELRFMASGQVWRVAFVFDSAREAVLLVAGSKSGTGQARFYCTLISRADTRYAAHLQGRGL
jgi:hypothetical protein